MSQVGLIRCPACGAENVEGADECERCRVSLVEVARPPLTALEARIQVATLADLLPRSPLLCRPETSVGQVLRTLVEKSIGAIVVVDPDRRPLGVFSERDALVKLNVDFAQLVDRPISEYMTAPAVTLPGEATLAQALHLMNHFGYRHVPITTDGRVTGILSIRDVMRYLTDELLRAELSR